MTRDENNLFSLARDGYTIKQFILRTTRLYDTDISIQTLRLFDLESMEEIVNRKNYRKVQKLVAWLSDKVRERLMKEKDMLMQYLDAQRIMLSESMERRACSDYEI